MFMINLHVPLIRWTVLMPPARATQESVPKHGKQMPFLVSSSTEYWQGPGLHHICWPRQQQTDTSTQGLRHGTACTMHDAHTALLHESIWTLRR